MPGHKGAYRLDTLGPQIFDTLVRYALAQIVVGILLDAHPVALGHILETRGRPQRMTD